MTTSFTILPASCTESGVQTRFLRERVLLAHAPFHLINM